MSASGNSEGGSRLGLTAAVCIVFVAGMVGMSFAAVPLYRLFCQVTGYGGTTQQAEAAPEHTLDRTVRVRFDANIGGGLGWSFTPRQREMTVKLGEVVEAAYVAENRTGSTSTGTALFNVTPGEAGIYFNKIDCFCFAAQTLGPGETAEFGVSFFVDPGMADDATLDRLGTITLSYTFFPSPAPDPKPVAANRLGLEGKPL
jgi:cytochrome c oxidase assembly protein subunit 11